jgi:hypothetical protein
MGVPATVLVAVVPSRSAGLAIRSAFDLLHFALLICRSKSSASYLFR